MVTPLVLIVYLSQALDPNQDWLGIIVFGFDFVIFSLILIALFNRIANSKAAKVWPKLAPVIKGTFHKGIGLTAPYLVGNYRGLPVRARLRVSAKSRWNFEYYFEIVATPGTRGQDWELRYNQRPREAQGWEIKTKDEALRQRLSQSGLMAMLPSWEDSTLVKYNSGRGTLLYRHRVYARDALPSPEVFQMQLDLLKKLVNINRQVTEEPVAGNLLNR